jgi:hypothetical protein
MKHKTKNTLRAMADHVGLKVKFVSYFGADIHGKLIPHERRILINANKPRCEHIFTMLHEIGHYLNHVLNPHRKHHPRWADLEWKTKWIQNFCAILRRKIRRFFNKESNKEWEADLWAICAFISLSKSADCKDDLCAFIKRHPEKLGLFMLAGIGVAYCANKQRITKPFKMLLKPFMAL